KSWRICAGTDEDGISEEVVFRLQGVLTKNNLVPKNVQACPQHKAIHLTQHAEICGMETEAFNQSINSIGAIKDLFEEHLPGAVVWSLETEEGHAGTLFSASNRVFTYRADDPTEQDTGFQSGVDPMHILNRLKGKDLIHAPENIVQYFKRAEVLSDDKPAYVTTVPGRFKIGDIVEMQLSFVALTSLHKKVKVTARLQALTLLSSKHTKVKIPLDPVQ
ncbi:hypothetical protein C8R44DRAFT_636894, partial [Mycena epipterygia]